MTAPFDHTCDDQELLTLATGVLPAFTSVAKCYAQETGQRLIVTSGKRTLRKTASIMADFTPAQLEALYCRNGYPSYIREMIAAQISAGRPLTGEEAYSILANRTEGYISAHLYGAALDIRTKGLLAPERLRTLLEEAGFRTLDETSAGIPCLHATFRSVPVQIIRE